MKRTSPLDFTGPQPRVAPVGLLPVEDRRAVLAARARAWALAAARSGALAVLYSMVTVLLTWPMAAHLGDRVSSPIDPVDSIWRVGWGQERLLHAPWRLFDGNTFYPYARSYLFDELLLGEALLALPFRLVTGNPVAIYNLAVLTSFVLSALAMYALARRLGARPAGAFAAGLIYAFAPLHLGHIGHLGILSGQWFPLAILLLDRIFERPRWRDALGLAAVLAMQALSSQYYAFYLVFVVGGFVGLRVAQVLLRRWFPSTFPSQDLRNPGTQELGWGVWGRLAVAGGLAGLAVLPFFVGYRSVQGDYAVERTIAQNAYYSANVASFFTADGQNLLWGWLTAPLRRYGTYTFERNLFPGLLALALALLGAIAAWRRPLAQYLILLGFGAALLALGPGLYLNANPKSLVFDYLPYRYLYYHLPGFDSMRVPARFGILYGLSVAALAGLGLTRLIGWVEGRRSKVEGPRRGRSYSSLVARRSSLVALLVIGGIGLESVNRPYALAAIEAGERVPPVYRWLAERPEAVVIELPFLIPDHDRELRINNRYQYFSLYHGHRIVNGSANVVPKGYKSLFYEFRAGPSARALALLQGLEVTHVVVHYDLLDGRLTEQTRATMAGLTEQVRQVAAFGPDVVYELLPTDRFAALRATVPREASVYLSREDPLGTGGYGAMLARVLRENRVYTRVRVEYGRDYAGPPEPGARYDYAILYPDEDPAAVGFAGAEVVWEDGVVRVYRRAGG